MKNFWLQLPKSFSILAPMEGVTDVVFRQMIAKIGKPDVFFTEFVMTDGICSAGREKTAESLMFEPNEQPIVAQIWGTKPENFFQTAKYVKELGFVGIDINMGCPVRDVTKHGSCAALIKNQPLASEIIQATKEGASGLPVSVKTRIGYSEEQIGEWFDFLFNQDLDALTIHLRTVKEMSKVPAHWELMPKIIDLRNKISPQTLIIGNGDILSLSEIRDKYEEYGCDGFMVGREIFTNPWLFNPTVNPKTVSIVDRLNLYLKHINLFETTWGTSKNSALLRKFCKTYINNFADASLLREKMMETQNLEELRECVLSLREQFTSIAPTQII